MPSEIACSEDLHRELEGGDEGIKPAAGAASATRTSGQPVGRQPVKGLPDLFVEEPDEDLATAGRAFLQRLEGVEAVVNRHPRRGEFLASL